MKKGDNTIGLHVSEKYTQKPFEELLSQKI